MQPVVPPVTIFPQFTPHNTTLHFLMTFQLQGYHSLPDGQVHSFQRYLSHEIFVQQKLYFLDFQRNSTVNIKLHTTPINTNTIIISKIYINIILLILYLKKKKILYRFKK